MICQICHSCFNFENSRWIFSCVVVALVFSTSCGYRSASKNRLSHGMESLAIIPFENETTTFEVEQMLTRSLVRAFVEKSSYRMSSDPTTADAILKGVVSDVSVNPVLFGGGAFGSTFLVTLRARVELIQRETEKVLFKNDNYIFREQYVINVDVENFFSELNPALDRISNDFAFAVVTTVLEQF